MNDSSNIVSASSMTRCVRSVRLILPIKGVRVVTLTTVYQPLCRYFSKVLRVATATSTGLCNDSWIILYMKKYHMLMYLFVCDVHQWHSLGPVF